MDAAERPDVQGLVIPIVMRIDRLGNTDIAALLRELAGGRVSEVVEIVWRRNLRVNQHPPNRRLQLPGRSRHEAEYR